MKGLIDLHYLPCLEYMSAILAMEEIVLEKNEHYVKQSYRNRCLINTANGPLKLIIPVTSKKNKALVSDVKIDYSTKWQNIHWRAIQSAYGKAPFYEHYAELLQGILFKSYKFLFDLNYDLLSFCLQSLAQNIVVAESNAYETVPSLTIMDLRSTISPKTSISETNSFKPIEYLQVFGNKFVPNLSVIDLLFCEGPNAIQIIKSSSGGYLNK